ncbi:MAG: Glu/Leu/Phe/Val dehydrogenase [bacterium]|nr:Glu/Leu/Phe/Val dehydrogenase [bacterium]
MGVFEAIGASTHEQVVYGHDPVSGLKAIVAIHSTALGPALGGTRFFLYSNEAAALNDVLRLSEAMSYKSAAAGLDYGGGKAVIIGDPGSIRTERLLRAYGRVVNSLGGRYITAEDVGTTTADMAIIRRETAHVAGLPLTHHGSGDPSPATARGVMAAIRAVAMRLWGDEELSGRHFAVQGVGKVGSSLVERLTKAGAAVTVADVNQKALEVAHHEFGAAVVDTDAIWDVECDVFAPCAMGGALNERTIARLKCEAVVGSANNQLATAGDANLLVERSITYAPDFVANAGGIINISQEANGYDWQKAAEAVDGITSALTNVFWIADDEDINPVQAAVRLAKNRIENVGGLRTRLSPGGEL